ncbi:zinc finger protein, predicted [Trypanosoma brucei gambiense DAL972]|uniref:Zinc finger protein, predicted n=2 Tax=Trypanosoma brucei TaxID=5691 RepID=C9ZZ53_TRYB9|nr:zinc finger protein, predicted [Trypanosoma brucei gambiense DAL972]CBH14702.1 zinc finger protein, predicted [Trypanosoma brucei gambiense DAL972]|eukprot:XP_011776968.1 zinc finger protein, predicted [Trypanosoma brucei gambiense DAL972]
MFRTIGIVRLWRTSRIVRLPASGLGTDAKSCTAPTQPLSTSSATSSSSMILKYPYRVVDTHEKLKEAVTSLQGARSIALDIEAFCTTDQAKQLGRISLVQACSDAKPVVFLFDVLTLTPDVFVKDMQSLLSDREIRKLFFDCRRDVEALSCQLGVKPEGVLDLQVFFTAIQWKLRSVNRRSGMGYVLKSVAGLTRQEGDSAVQTAMTLGNRPVWDIRPLPDHFLEYAAGDVRHILLLSNYLVGNKDVPVDVVAVERLTAQYVEHYAVGKPVITEADATPAEVNRAWLERYIGPGGGCHFCGAKGHTEAECFKKQNGKAKCSFCGEVGHTARNCFKKHPQLLTCEKCGQLGHTGASCFRTNPCKHCGGPHSSANCHKVIWQQKRLGENSLH